MPTERAELADSERKREDIPQEFTITYCEQYGVSWGDYISTKIEDVFSHPRVLHALQNVGILSLGQLLRLSKLELMKIKCLGANSIKEIDVLLERKFHAGEQPDIFHSARESTYDNSSFPRKAQEIYPPPQVKHFKFSKCFTAIKDEDEIGNSSSIHTTRPQADIEYIENNEAAEVIEAKEPIESVEIAADERDQENKPQGNEKDVVPYYEYFGVAWDSYTGIKIEDVFSYPRVLHALQHVEVMNLGQLLSMSKLDLMEIRNLGARSIKEIDDELERIFHTGERPDIFFAVGENKHNYSNSGAQRSLKSEFIKLHRTDIAIGNFDFIGDDSMSEEDHTIEIAKYREAYEDLGSQLAYTCFSEPDKILPILQTFRKFASDKEHRDIMKSNIQKLLNELPEERRSKSAVNYVRIFAGDDPDKRQLLSYYSEIDISLSEFANRIDVSCQEIYRVAYNFFRWCNFDIHKDIARIATLAFKQDRTRTVVRMRSDKHTLEEVGKHFDVTRERVRQIEAKAGRIVLSMFRRDNILLKISAELNGETILPVLVLDEYFGQYSQEIIYLLKNQLKYESYNYDGLLDAFVIGDELPADKIQDAIDQLPEYFPIDKSAMYVSRISDDLGIPADAIEKALNEVYRLTGNIYHRIRLTRSAIYSETVRKYYPDGIWVYDKTTLQNFRQHLLDDYGINVFEQSDHALASIIMRNCILCDRGTYRIKVNSYLSQDLQSRIYMYIKTSSNNIILVNAVFEEFADELELFGVKNKYYLFGILQELYSSEFIFRKGYIYKSSEASSIYTEIVHFVKQSKVPISKEEIYRKFPGITEIVIQIALNDDSILNYFGEYLYASYLDITGSERSYLKGIMDHVLSDKQGHHCKDIYERVASERPEIFTRNGITFGFRLYSVLEYLFRDSYQFSRPYIALNDVVIGRAPERLREFITSVDEISIAEISEFAKENHYSIYSMIDFINSYNEMYFFRDHDTIARIEVLGVSEQNAREIEALILDEISGTEIVANLECIHRFPSIAVPWNEWLVYSVIKRWASKLDVTTSSTQLRIATPLVAIRGQLDLQKYDGIQDLSKFSVIQADDLDDIDSLIADYILDGDTE